MKFNQFADLSKRFSVTIAIFFVLILLIAFSANPIVSVFVVAAVAAMAGVGVWEYAKLASTKGVKPAVALMVIVAACEVVAFFIAHKWIHSQELPVFVFAVGLGLFFLNRFRKAEEALVNVAVDFFGVAYVAVPLSYMLAILYPIGPSPVIDGRWWLFYLIAVTKITDVGAYFIGRLWGKTALAPILSPKKTVEGGIGGLACAVLFSLGMVYLGKTYAGTAFPLKYLDALWLGLLIGVFGQIGDLAESMLKRDADVKDSNRIPGLGGVLDMIDSLIFTAPIVYFYLRWYTLS
ncbi:MAG: Phosphatidate cytidylyltransferase [Chlamydiae bacterium]|nr:Phosphatidate cytidylyltransferase [Chlamydiota bacterium]